MRNTDNENILLERLEKIADLLETKREGKDYRLPISVQQNIESVLEQIKITYPLVSFPETLLYSGCSSCDSFIHDLIPVYDRLKSQVNDEEIELGSMGETEEPKEVKAPAKRGRKIKGKDSN
ncbi:hypothetical protein [Sphingobacterium sp.]|uniref:hypothetical protein n=1 Tax=Sphingobacterium sp. TaxID=341027 RepID=UPI0028A721FE|nr:hypothetical protein [Sphingobacterium sp.]